MNSIHKNTNYIILLLFSFIFSSYAQTGKFKVVLDAGHGGKDFGAVYNGHTEKNIALAVVLRVGKILEKNPNIDVLYTRNSDEFIELDERANIANSENATIFVSIHCNANKSPVGEGFETYVMGVARNKSNFEVAKLENEVITLEKDYKQKYEGYNPNSPESIIGIMLQQEEFIDNSIALAGKIQENFSANKERKSRGVKQAGFLVLRKIAMPRILIEMGFISNTNEGNYLDSDDGKDQIADAIASAITSYKKEYFGAGTNEPIIERPKTKTPNETGVEAPKTAVKEVVSKPIEEKKPSPPSDIKGIVFKVQISAGVKKLEPTPSNFKGLKNITVNSDNGTFFKYMYGETSDYNQAKQDLIDAKAKGFQSAYLVAFKDGKKIDMKEATKKQE